ncbi:hypothetical protein [Chloroflexus sp.]|uniref:hypothetical protein n=1 Tax=Chloroflexus sp. TaxID=1904827 RepID=UPI002ACED8E5|nr:hypothetical protein [Chloroflexus sp.]
MPAIYQRAILAILGLICITISIVVAFQHPFGLWHWFWLALAGLCLYAVRRMA